jgi:hypothetical protein
MIKVSDIVKELQDIVAENPDLYEALAKEDKSLIRGNKK